MLQTLLAALGVLTALVIADLTTGTGRFNLAQVLVGTLGRPDLSASVRRSDPRCSLPPRSRLRSRRIEGIFTLGMTPPRHLIGLGLSLNSTPMASALSMWRRGPHTTHANIHWQLADGDRVTTFKTYHGTHKGEFFGVAPTGRRIQFETVDVMRVRDDKITEHWGVANLFSLMTRAPLR